MAPPATLLTLAIIAWAMAMERRWKRRQYRSETEHQHKAVTRARDEITFREVTNLWDDISDGTREEAENLARLMQRAEAIADMTLAARYAADITEILGGEHVDVVDRYPV